MAPGSRSKCGAPCPKLRSFGSKCTALKKVLVTLLWLFGAPAVIWLLHSDSAPGESRSPCTPLVTSLRWWFNRSLMAWSLTHHSKEYSSRLTETVRAFLQLKEAVLTNKLFFNNLSRVWQLTSCFLHDTKAFCFVTLSNQQHQNDITTKSCFFPCMGVRRGSKMGTSTPWKLGLSTKNFQKTWVSSLTPINLFNHWNDSLFAGMTLTLHRGEFHCSVVMQWWACWSLISAPWPAEARCEIWERIALPLVVIA